MTASSIHRARRRASALVALLAACSTLAACGASASPTPDPKPKPILTEKSVVGVWKDYDKRNNAALVQAGPPSYDAMAYDTADIGPLLDQDVTSVKLDEHDREERGKPSSTTSEALYAPEESAGFALSSTRRSGDEASDPPHLRSLVRTGDPATWMQELSVEVQQPSGLPRPLDPGQDSTATTSDVERARTVVASISEYWRTLRKPSGVKVGNARYADFVKTATKFRTSTFDVSSQIVIEGIPKTPGVGEALRVVRAKGGLLVVVNVRLRSILTAHEPGVTISLSGITGKVLGTRPAAKLQVHWSSTLAISVPDQGQAVVFGTSFVPLVK